MFKHLENFSWTAKQLGEAIAFLQATYGEEFTKLPWENRMKLAFDLVSIRKQRFQEKRYVFQLFAGPVPALIAVIISLIAFFK